MNFTRCQLHRNPAARQRSRLTTVSDIAIINISSYVNSQDDSEIIHSPCKRKTEGKMNICGKIMVKWSLQKHDREPFGRLIYLVILPPVLVLLSYCLKQSDKATAIPRAEQGRVDCSDIEVWQVSAWDY